MKPKSLYKNYKTDRTYGKYIKYHLEKRWCRRHPMSIIKRMLEDLSALHGDGIHSGKRNSDSKGNLKHHHTVDDIDPVSIRGGDSEKDKNKFKADVSKRASAKDNNDKLSEALTQPAGEHNHIHEFIPGEQRTTIDHGHDHAIVYENGKAVRTGPGPSNGHIHLI